MSAQKIVARLLEAEEFDAREYLARTPYEEFDEAAADILNQARELYAYLQRNNVLQVSRGPVRGSIGGGPDDSAIAQAVLQLALEKRGSPGARRAYLRIKRHGRFLI